MEKGAICWEGGVDSWSVPYICGKWDIFWDIQLWKRQRPVFTEAGVDSERVAYSFGKGCYIFGEKAIV